MTSVNNSYIEQDDLFSLAKLFQYFWQKKWWIILSTLIFTGAAYFYANSIKPEWSTSAEAIPANNNAIEKLLDLNQRYALISGEKFAADGVAATLFNQFVTNTFIYDVRKNYFLESALYKELSKTQSDAEKKATLEKWIKNINVVTPDMTKKGNNITVITAENKALADIPSVKLTFTDTNAQLLQKTLDGFVQFTNKITYQQAMADFLIRVKQKITALKYQQKQIEEQLVLEKQAQIQHLQAALAIAQSAGGTKEGLQLNLSLNDEKANLANPYLYLLGSQNLAAQLAGLEQQKFIYSTAYYTAKQQITDLVKLVDDAEALTIDAFQYKTSPTYPYKVKPQKALILAIGFLFGLVLSCMILLFIRVLKKK